MEPHLRNVWAAAAELEILQFRMDRSHAGLVRSLSEAMAANVPAEAVAEAAGMSVAELLAVLGSGQAGPAAAAGKDGPAPG
jgi:hypothetical protein